MKIGFDAKRAVQNNTGLGNYSRYLVQILSDYFPDHSYLLFAPKKKDNPRLHQFASKKSIRFIYPRTFFQKLFPALWRSSWIKSDLQREELRLFHGLSNELPFGIDRIGVKSVVTIHDLIFLRYPEYYKPIDRFIYRWKFKYACQKADKIIAASECTKRDIVSYLQIPEDKIQIVYQGCDPVFKHKVSFDLKQAVSEKYGLPSQFLLYVGSIESRKNLMLIVKALRLLPDGIHLVAIGKKTPYQEQVEQYAVENGLESRLQIFNGISFDDLPVFYSLAKIFIYPSFFEGFGIPIVEALSQGIPVIAATGSCLEEAGGSQSLYVDPMDKNQLAEKILEVWSSPELASSMSEAGREYVKRFSEERIASDLMQVYTSLL